MPDDLIIAPDDLIITPGEINPRYHHLIARLQRERTIQPNLRKDRRNKLISTSFIKIYHIWTLVHSRAWSQHNRKWKASLRNPSESSSHMTEILWKKPCIEVTNCYTTALFMDTNGYGKSNVAESSPSENLYRLYCQLSPSKLLRTVPFVPE